MNSFLNQVGLKPADLGNIALLPKIRRARDYHCYDFSTRRYLDLFRADGASLLGYSVPGFQLAIKNRVSQALWQALPHPLFKQLTRALTNVLPNHKSLICPDRETLRVLLELFGCSLDRPLLPSQMDFRPNSNPQAFSVWQPFNPGQINPAPTVISVAVLPRPAFSGPLIVLVPEDIYQRQAEPRGQELTFALDFIAHQTPVYAVQAVLSGLTALTSLGAFATNATVAVKDPPHQLGKWTETSWINIDLGKWRRVGPYLLHDFSPAQYSQVFKNALHRGIILNPRSEGINFLPGIISGGEQKSLEHCLSFQPLGD